MCLYTEGFLYPFLKVVRVRVPGGEMRERYGAGILSMTLTKIRDAVVDTEMREHEAVALMFVYLAFYPSVVENIVIVVGLYEEVVDILKDIGDVVGVSEEYQRSHLGVRDDISEVGDIVLYAKGHYDEITEAVLP